jgi:hypothetical protein
VRPECKELNAPAPVISSKPHPSQVLATDSKGRLIISNGALSDGLSRSPPPVKRKLAKVGKEHEDAL